MSERYDIAIIGTGPAGLSASLNAKIRKMKFIIFGSKDLSIKITKAPKINNYLGFPSLTGQQMQEQFQNHIDKMGIEITDKKITNIYSMKDYFTLLSGSDFFEAKTIILATGVSNEKTIKGEDDFLGRGVGYCATCDAPLYKDKIVSIIAYSKSDEKEAEFIATYAKKVYYIPMYKDCENSSENVEIVDDIPIEIKGEKKVSHLILKSREIKTDGVFILRESIAPSKLIDGLEIENNHIVVDRKMRTNIKGCFASGDITGTPYQYAKAVGEGNIASLSAVEYLSKL